MRSQPTGKSVSKRDEIAEVDSMTATRIYIIRLCDFPLLRQAFREWFAVQFKRQQAGQI